MFRFFSRRAIAVSGIRHTTEAAKPMTYETRLHELEADPECPLSQHEYKVLQEKLKLYSELQGEYSVKQSDIERTKRAANVCGLDFPDPTRRPTASK